MADSTFPRGWRVNLGVMTVSPWNIVGSVFFRRGGNTQDEGSTNIFQAPKESIRIFMASTTFSLEVAEKALEENGFFDLEDPAMGEYVEQMERRSFPFVSEYGLDFCKERVLDDEVSTPRLLSWQLFDSF